MDRRDGLAENLPPDATEIDGSGPKRDGAGADRSRADSISVVDAENDRGVADAGNLALGAACQSNPQCASRHCADGVCCNLPCDGRCAACNTTGQCMDYAAGTDPDGECAGGTAICAGTCDGKGGCQWPVGKFCDGRCSLKAGLWILTKSVCFSGGQCNALPVAITCGKWNRCSGAGIAAQCNTDGSCEDQGDCTFMSACDLAQAHVSGKGVCVDPARVYRHRRPATLALSVTVAQTTGRGYLKVGPGKYGGFELVTGTLTVVGSGSAAIVGGSSLDRPLVSVEQGAALVLQGLTISGSASAGPDPDLADGLYCSSPAGGPTSHLTVIDSTITSNAGQGIDARSCFVAVRRSRILSNGMGGLLINGSKLVLTNSLIANNGSLSTLVGGLRLVKTSGSVVNVTVASNRAGPSAQLDRASGFFCDGAPTPTIMLNNIVWLNAGTGQATKNCAFQSSSIQGRGMANPMLTTAFVPTSAAAIDRGSSAASAGKLDLNGGPRVKGAAIDLGAFEVR